MDELVKYLNNIAFPLPQYSINQAQRDQYQSQTNQGQRQTNRRQTNQQQMKTYQRQLQTNSGRGRQISGRCRQTGSRIISSRGRRIRKDRLLITSEVGQGGKIHEVCTLWFTLSCWKERGNVVIKCSRINNLWGRRWIQKLNATRVWAKAREGAVLYEWWQEFQREKKGSKLMTVVLVPCLAGRDAVGRE